MHTFFSLSFPLDPVCSINIKGCMSVLHCEWQHGASYCMQRSVVVHFFFLPLLLDEDWAASSLAALDF